MPLLRIDLLKGRSPAELKQLLDAAHRAMLAAFKVPVRDRYQIVTEHTADTFIIEDTGLGIPRTKNVVFVQVTTRPRSQEAKEEFYVLLVNELKQFGTEASDVVVSMVVNSDEDWSFGHGRAQFLTGEL